MRGSDDIHLSPVRARLLDWEEKGDVLKGYVWSSYLEIAGYGKPGLCAGKGKDGEELRQGWSVGKEGFAQGLLELVERGLEERRSGSWSGPAVEKQLLA